MKRSIDTYKRLNDSFIPMIKAVEKNTVPSSEDYNNKYIIRYFLKEVTSGRILEVSYKNWESITKFLYIRVSLKWYISGDKNAVFVNGVMQSPGVLELNERELNDAEKVMSGIKLKLKDTTQFYK